MELWVDKYKPKTLDDIIGNDSKVKAIEKWFEEFNNPESKKILLLSGPPGIGKTSIANIALKKYGYSIIEFNSSIIRGPKNIREIFGNILDCRSVIDMFCEGNKPTGVIMDEIDTLCNGGDKGGMAEFIAIIKEHKVKNKFNIRSPIICTYNDFNDKKIKELANLSVEVKMSKPTDNDLMQIIDKIEKMEGLDIDFDAKHFIIKHSLGDIRKLISLLYDLYLSYGKNRITLEDFEKIIETFVKKNVDTHIFEMTFNIFNKKLKSEDITNYYDSDKLQLPMMIHENYIQAILNRNIDDKTKKITVLECADILIKNDIYQTSNYENQTWEMPDIMAYTYCLKINEISQFRKMLSNHDKINYSTLLNNMSNYHKNRKMINTIGSKLNINMSYEDIFFLSEIIAFHLFNKNGNKENLVKIMKHYEISIDDMEFSRLKLICDEIFGPKNFVTCLVLEKKKKGTHLDKQRIYTCLL